MPTVPRGAPSARGARSRTGAGLVFEQVGHVALLVEHACALLAAVAGDEAAVLAGGFIFAEVVHGKQAVVRAGLAAHGFVRGAKASMRPPSMAVCVGEMPARSVARTAAW